MDSVLYYILLLHICGLHKEKNLSINMLLVLQLTDAIEDRVDKRFCWLACFYCIVVMCHSFYYKVYWQPFYLTPLGTICFVSLPLLGILLLYNLYSLFKYFPVVRNLTVFLVTDFVFLPFDIWWLHIVLIVTSVFKRETICRLVSDIILNVSLPLLCIYIHINQILLLYVYEF